MGLRSARLAAVLAALSAPLAAQITKLSQSVNSVTIVPGTASPSTLAGPFAANGLYASTDAHELRVL